MGNFIALVVRGGQSIVVFAREVNDLDAGLRKEWSGAEENLVDACRSLAAAGHEKRGTSGIQTENLHGFASIHRLAQIFSHRRASDNAVSSGEPLAAIFEAKKNAGCKPRRQAVGTARNGIGLVDEAGQALHARGENRRGGCEAAHAKNHGRTVFSINRTTLAVAIPAATDKAYEGGRQKHRRHADRWQFFSPELRMRLECDGIDFLFRHKKQNLVAALVERLRDGKTGEEMPACAATGNDGSKWFLVGHMRGSKCGRVRAGAKWETSGRPWRWMFTSRPMRNRQTTKLEPP